MMGGGGSMNFRANVKRKSYARGQSRGLGADRIDVWNETCEGKRREHPARKRNSLNRRLINVKEKLGVDGGERAGGGGE